MRDIYNVEIIKAGQVEFPARLKEIPQCPKQLYFVGDIKLLERKCVSVVGSRTTTTYGRKIAESISARLAERGVTVVSGMAKGIDSFAHQGALSVKGATAAVFGCGVDICYPPENRNLMDELMKKGLILSEYAPGTQPSRYNFPQRNRIISGLSECTIVVQARNRSGALITAEFAMDQGREVYAVPGNIDSQYNLGNNKLIKEGAIPLISVDDILEPLGLKQISNEEAKIRLSPSEFEIYSAIKKQGEMTIDEISYIVKKPAAYINPILAVMEMKGFVFSEMGKFFLANV